MPKHITIRNMPDELGRRLRRLSVETGRSLNATVLGVLEQALDACVPGGAAFKVEWKWDGGKAKDVVVAKSSAKGNDKCVVAAVAKTKAATDGSCSATILVGKSEAARKAADSLK
ncbi:MAG: hypothetical protein HY906_22275 [Deltaproteobacteria bacterium]|nr:hypothetical protein [Deltaproteobacteria bacterium]